MTCELVIINQNVKYRLYSLYTFILVQGQVNRNFQLVLNEMGPGRTSWAWCFHSPVYIIFNFQYGFVREKSSGHVDTSKVYTMGKYFVGPGYDFKVYPRNAQTIQLDKVAVFTADRLEV